MAIVIFTSDEFKERYPQFADFPEARLQTAFEVACLVLDNSQRSPVPYAPPAVSARKTVLHLLVCHLCEMTLRGNGIVGSMSQATQGSISASFTVPANADAQWFNQTQCGGSAWQLLSGFILGGRLYNGCFR